MRTLDLRLTLTSASAYISALLLCCTALLIILLVCQTRSVRISRSACSMSSDKVRRLGAIRAYCVT